MIAAEVPQAEGSRPERPRPPRTLIESPASSWAWLLRTAAIVAVAAAAMGTIVAPGIRGNGRDAVVVGVERCSSMLGCSLLLMLVGLTLLGTMALARAHAVPLAPRIGMFVGAVLATSGATAFLTLGDGVPIDVPFMADATAALGLLCGGYCALLAPHTRAVGGVLIVVAFASITRLGAWLLATRAGDAASIQMFMYSRDLATAGVLLEAGAQLLSVTWLWSRGPSGGQVALAAALVSAWVIAWGAASGGNDGAPLWQAVLHTSIGRTLASPLPYTSERVSSFLVPASLLIALVAGAQRRMVVAVVAALALVLVSRGWLDAPLRALCAVVGAQWATLASVDDRALWRTLLDRKPLAPDAELAKSPGGP